MKRAFWIIPVFIMLMFSMTACGKAAEETSGSVTEIISDTTGNSSGNAASEKNTENPVTEKITTEQITTEQVTEKETEADTEVESEDNSEDNSEDYSEDNSEGGNKEVGAAKLFYQGHASMRITTAEGMTIYVDPFMGRGYDVPADLILMTHGHYDHTQTQLIETKNTGCETISWKEALAGGKHRSFDLGYVKVEAVEAGYNQNHDVSNCVGFILTFTNGVTLYLSGDTSTTPQMKELAGRSLDYAFFCCDGVYNMDMQEAIACARLVGAKHSIPYHMVPSNNSNGFEQAVAEKFDVPGRIIVKPGEELVLE